MLGGCDCGNIQLRWQVVDFSLVPRACQCSYCVSHGAEYVSKTGSRFEATIHKPALHRIVRHGSNSAHFHECRHCKKLVFVTAEICGEVYGVINARQLVNKLGFAPAVPRDFSGQSANDKQQRWRETWCYPVRIISPREENLHENT